MVHHISISIQYETFLMVTLITQQAQGSPGTHKEKGKWQLQLKALLCGWGKQFGRKTILLDEQEGRPTNRFSVKCFHLWKDALWAETAYWSALHQYIP